MVEQMPRRNEIIRSLGWDGTGMCCAVVGAQNIRLISNKLQKRKKQLNQTFLIELPNVIRRNRYEAIIHYVLDIPPFQLGLNLVMCRCRETASFETINSESGMIEKGCDGNPLMSLKLLRVPFEGY